MKSFTLQPVQEDVLVQITATNELLEVIDTLNKVADKATGDQKDAVSMVIKKLNDVSDRLIDNATATSNFIRQVA